MKLRLLTLTLLLCSNLALAAETPPGVNLDSLLAYAQQHHPDLAIREAEKHAARARVEAVSEFPDPRFDYERMDVKRDNPGMQNDRYTIGQSIPYWGKLNLRGELAQAQASQREQAWESQWLELQMRIKAAFARYYRSYAQLDIIDRNLALLNSLQHQAETRYGVGLVPQQDSLRAYSEITALKVERVEVERELRTGKALLNSLLPRQVDAELARPLELEPLHNWPALPQLLNLAHDQTPQLAEQRLKVLSAEKNRDLTRLNRLPDFTLAVRNNRPETGNSNWDVMVGVDIPLRQYTRSAQQREAEAMLNAEKLQLSASEIKLDGQISVLLTELNANRDKIQLLKHTLLPQIEANLASSQAGYETGQVGFNVVIEAAIKILRTRLELLNSEVSARIQQAELEQLTGKRRL